MAKMLATTGSATAAALKPSGLGCSRRHHHQPTMMMSPSVVASDCHRGFATLSFASRRNSCNISASIEKGSSWSGPAARRFGSNASSGRRSSAMFVSSAADDANKSVVASSSAATALETPRLDDSDGGSDGGEGSNNGGSGGGGPDRGGDGNGDEDGKPSDADVAEVVAAVGTLPKDFQAALKLGTLTMADLKKWQQIRGIPIIGAIAAAFQGFRERMMGNPRFLLAVAAEELIGGSAKMAAEVEARKDKFFQELPFVASDMALELICNFTVVWLLSPVRSFTPAPTGGISKALNALPGHFLQVGNFSWGQRIGNLAFRCLQFGTAGIFASAAGHSLVVLSLKNDPKAQEDLAPTHKVAGAWGAFMAVSSNIRYQLVNCWEERFLEVFVPNKAINTLVTFVVRFGNCYIGGQQWIWFARQLDLQ